MIKKSKSSFFISSESESDSESDVEYEEGDCFDLDDEWKPIPRVIKKELCDKTRIKNYILFSIIMTLFGYILYNTIHELYK
jgi:hypothetical protein